MVKHVYFENLKYWQLCLQDSASSQAEGMPFFHNYILTLIGGIAVTWSLWQIFYLFDSNKKIKIFLHFKELEILWTILPSLTLFFNLIKIIVVKILYSVYNNRKIISKLFIIIVFLYFFFISNCCCDGHENVPYYTPTIHIGSLSIDTNTKKAGICYFSIIVGFYCPAIWIVSAMFFYDNSRPGNPPSDFKDAIPSSIPEKLSDSLPSLVESISKTSSNVPESLDGNSSGILIIGVQMLSYIIYILKIIADNPVLVSSSIIILLNIFTINFDRLYVDFKIIKKILTIKIDFWLLELKWIRFTYLGPPKILITGSHLLSDFYTTEYEKFMFLHKHFNRSEVILFDEYELDWLVESASDFQVTEISCNSMLKVLDDLPKSDNIEIYRKWLYLYKNYLRGFNNELGLYFLNLQIRPTPEYVVFMLHPYNPYRIQFLYQ